MAIKQSEIITASDVVEELSKKLNTDDLVSNLLNKIYPIGSIYISLNNISPASFLGGSWSQLPEGFALWTASSGLSLTNDKDNAISAGLPNITGELYNKGLVWGSCQYATNEYQTGAIGIGYRGFNGEALSVGGENISKWGVDIPLESIGQGNFFFNASKSNSIYGNSTTVQPPAYKVYAWKRTA